MEEVLEEVKKEQLNLKTKSVLFVCSGNTCRSPMAEAVAKDLQNKLNKTEYSFCSAGLYVLIPQSITDNAVFALKSANILSTEENPYLSHKSHQITQNEVSQAQMIVAMTNSIAMQLAFEFPMAISKIKTMPNEISDPYGGDLEEYKLCLEQITNGVKKLFFDEHSQDN